MVGRPMRRPSLSLLVLVVMLGCGAGSVVSTPPAAEEHEAGTATPDDASSDAGGDWEAGSDAGQDGAEDAGTDAESDAGEDADASVPDAGGPTTIRIMAANLTSGNRQSYDPGEGIRIFQGLKPDVVLIQELNYKNNTNEDIRSFVTTAFSEDYTYHRESGAQIPNGVISRYPIVASGQWADPKVSNRSFVYAKIAVPGAHPLWAVSVHFVTSGASARNEEARSLTAQLKAVVSLGDYVVIGGNLNTDSRNESCIATLGQIVATQAPHPADGANNSSTNASRSKPYDWVLANPTLGALRVPTVVGASQFPAGLVFDSRGYAPLSEVAPVTASDSAASNMQHMAVVKDFRLP
jgi:endonuclease/exonuclease/phosphatase family metal-dependent hydrolase